MAIDETACVILSGPKYILTGGRLPSSQETISSKTGRSAIRGKPWALLAERAIDRLFVLLGEADGHCRRSIVPDYNQ